MGIRLLLLHLILIILSADAQAADGEWRARFTVFAGGREAGHETASFTVDGKHMVLESRALLHRDGRKQDLRLTLRIDRETGAIHSFFARGTQGDRERVVTLAATDGRLAGEIREGENAVPVALDAKAGLAVLAEPFAAPWLLLAERYDFERGGAQAFPVCYPLAGKVGSVSLRLRNEEALEIDGRAVLARRLLGEPDRGDTANLWVDAQGSLLVCARSVAGISAVRGEALRIGLKPGDDPSDPEGTRTLRVRFAAEGGITLAGSFMRPKGSNGRTPAALLISGSGPHDRNGNVPGAELQWNYLHSFAAALAREGIATLRYDERGVGRSGGTFYDAGLSDLVDDAGGALSYLASREDVDPLRIAVLGHSEGAIIAALLAGRPEVRSLVLLGAPAEPLDRILLGQVRLRLTEKEKPERETQQILGDLRAFFEHVRLAKSDRVEWRGRHREARWLREHVDLDPLAVYRRVTCPTLVLHGARDAQVPVAHASRVAGALNDGKASIHPSLDHFLMVSRDGRSEYGDSGRRVAESALAEAAVYLRNRLR